MFLFIVRLVVFSVILQIISCNWGDPPELQAQEDKLFALGTNETYIMETWKIQYFHSNTGICKWIYAGNSSRPHVVMISLSSYVVMQVAENFGNWTLVEGPRLIELYQDHVNPTAKTSFAGADFRIYLFNGKYRVAFVAGSPASQSVQAQYYADVHYSASRGLYVVQGGVHSFNIEQEVGARQQKNWSPFVYRLKVSMNDAVVSTTDQNLFIYSVNPHKIVHGNESIAGSGVIRAHTVSMTTAPEPPAFWSYGEARGGTPGIIVRTEYGTKYLTFFHSQNRGPTPQTWLKTYYMGAYLFDPTPPFAITHMTPDAIISHVLYDEATSGWAFKAIDYIVFPVGAVVLDGVVYVTMGRNDNSAYALSLNLTGLVHSMRPVYTITDRNGFFRHMSDSYLAGALLVGDVSEPAVVTNRSALSQQQQQQPAKRKQKRSLLRRTMEAVLGMP